MNKLNEWIIWHFGKTGFYVYCVLIGVINLLPLIVIGAPVWVIILVSLALWFVPVLQFPYLAVWIWALVVCLGKPFTWLSAVYYISFALYFGNQAVALFKKDKMQ
jgi:hypothetical protein